jgi:hypothetical protein
LSQLLESGPQHGAINLQFDWRRDQMIRLLAEYCIKKGTLDIVQNATKNFSQPS